MFGDQDGMYLYFKCYRFGYQCEALLGDNGTFKKGFYERKLGWACIPEGNIVTLAPFSLSLLFPGHSFVNRPPPPCAAAMMHHAIQGNVAK